MIEDIILILQKEIKKYQSPVISLIKQTDKDIFKILISTILSSRTNDKITINVSNKLFTTVKNFEDIERLSLEQLENLIYPIGFYRTKAKVLKKLTIVIKEKFNNKIPNTLEELMQLPGVGRKTANLVLSLGFNKSAIAVDTHVHRITNRIGIVNTQTPYETELELMKLVPNRYWNDINYIFVAFGQSICKPINPKCNICPINFYCKYKKRAT